MIKASHHTGAYVCNNRRENPGDMYSYVLYLEQYREERILICQGIFSSNLSMDESMNSRPQQNAYWTCK